VFPLSARLCVADANGEPPDTRLHRRGSEVLCGPIRLLHPRGRIGSRDGGRDLEVQAAARRPKGRAALVQQSTEQRHGVTRRYFDAPLNVRISLCGCLPCKEEPGDCDPDRHTSWQCRNHAAPSGMTSGDL
jgi:hypothetical protein